MRKASFLILAALLAASAVFAGGAEESQAGGKRIVTTTNAAIYAGEQWFIAMNKAFEDETGIHVVVDPVPGDEMEYVNKTNIDLLAGSDVDVVETLGPKNFSMRIDAGYFAPLDEIVDVPKALERYGRNIPHEEDGHFYALPFKQELYCVYYNKDLFDKAGVEYPSGAWTWDEYVQTALALTDADAGVWGSFMNADIPWMYLWAQQDSQLELYTSEGLCNFDNPLTRRAAEWFHHISNDLKIQPSIADLEAENANWNYYALAGDHLAMFPQGNWFTRLLNDQTDYPRDWKYGIAPLPTTGSESGRNNLGSLGYVSINKNAAHPEEARIYMEWLAENQWKYEGGIPALSTLTKEQQDIAFGAIAEASGGQVTVSDLYENLVHTGLGNVPGDIVGPSASEYYTAVKSELKAYNMDLESLDEAMANIQRRVDEAIRNSR